MPESEPTRQAESSVVPPPRTDVKYKEVAAIPPGGGAVLIPKGPEVIQPKAPELPVVEDPVSSDGVTSVPSLPPKPEFEPNPKV